MIQEFVDQFMENKDALRKVFATKHPDNYEEIVKNVAWAIRSDRGGDLDPERITVIDDGNYQGTLVFVIGEAGYQPSDYWYVKVSYGSCSGCDTLEAIRRYDNEPPTDDQVDGYMTLALHIVQGIKKMGDEYVS
jgi:hypothetical protein